MVQTPSNADACQPGPLWQRALPVGCLILLLVGFSFFRVPIPGVNEPHYLGKAKHFWSPEWCAGDLFFESSNPHFVFYATFGPLTTFLSLSTTAIIGRCVALAIVAFGWQALARQLLGHAWAGLLTMPVFLMLQSLGNWSGEWLVGGLESKVIAYGFLFLSLARFLAGDWDRSALLAGLSVSVHPLIGLWGVIAAGFAWTFEHCCIRAENRIAAPRSPWCWLRAAGLFLVMALPGLIPALRTIAVDDPDLQRRANLLQVGSRLAHHLDPLEFSLKSHGYGGVVLLCWVILTTLLMRKFRRVPADQNLVSAAAKWRWWTLFVCATILIAFAGIGIAWGPRPIRELPGYEWRINLLKFYPFRLADLFVPVAISLALGRLIPMLCAPVQSRFQRRAGLIVCLAVTAGAAILLPGTDRNPSGMSATQRMDWIAICHWVREHSASDDLIYAINGNWAVKWYTARAEYVSYKDCPQDPPGIVEWNKRLWVIHRWKLGCFDDGKVSAGELADLHEKTGISFFIAGRFGPIDVPPTQANEHFQAYDLRTFRD